MQIRVCPLPSSPFHAHPELYRCLSSCAFPMFCYYAHASAGVATHRRHDVMIVDNLSRRKIDLELGCDSLTPIQSPQTRLKVSISCTF